MKFFLWKCLVWIDNNINHAIVENFFNLFSMNDFWYSVWLNTSRKFCNWVIIDLPDAGWNERKK